MTYSKIGICNVALASIGAASIRSFDESNKRARMCDVFFDICRDLLLSKFDWPFARKYAQLTALDMTDVDAPDGDYIYVLPIDCKIARDIGKRGNDTPWHIMSDGLHCTLASEVYLFYTYKVTDSAKFSDSFADLLAMLLAVKIAPAITQDKDLVKILAEMYRIAQVEAWETDANVGDGYREHDEDPVNDTFVNPNDTVSDETGTEPWYNR